MRYVECRTQADLDAVKPPDVAVVRNGSFTAYGSSQVRACGSSQVTACGSSQVTAYGSSQVTACDSSQVRACGSSQVRACGSSQVTAYDSSQVTAYDSSQVTAYGSSQVRAYGSSQVTACGSSQVTACDSSQVTACDSSQVTAYDSSQVTASPLVAVTRSGKHARVDGGVLIDIPDLGSVESWLAYYGLKPTRAGYVTLFKGVNAGLESNHGFAYPLGRAEIVCPDWKPTDACGNGLHLSPRPFMTHKYCVPERYVACKVRVSDIVPITDAAGGSDKCKVRAIVERWEVTEDGDRIEATS